MSTRPGPNSIYKFFSIKICYAHLKCFNWLKNANEKALNQGSIIFHSNLLIGSGPGLPPIWGLCWNSGRDSNPQPHSHEVECVNVTNDSGCRFRPEARGSNPVIWLIMSFALKRLKYSKTKRPGMGHSKKRRSFKLSTRLGLQFPAKVSSNASQIIDYSAVQCTRTKGNRFVIAGTVELKLFIGGGVNCVFLFQTVFHESGKNKHRGVREPLNLITLLY